MQFQNSAAAIFIFVILNILPKKNILPKTLMPQFLNLKKKTKKLNKSIYITSHLKQNSTSKFEDQIGFIQQFVNLELSHLANKKRALRSHTEWKAFIHRSWQE